MMKNIDEEYYGYRDEDDGIILPLEIEAEKLGKNAFLAFVICVILNTLFCLITTLEAFSC
jgi:Isy1-like splicing family